MSKDKRKLPENSEWFIGVDYGYRDDSVDALVYAMRSFPRPKRTLWTRIKAAWRGMMIGWGKP